MTSSFSFHHSPSDQKYDAIVIGAGLSGLTAAAYLAQAGARVLVCEQAEQIGGLFNSFERNGYQFDSGIKAVENSAVMLPMLAQLGLLVAGQWTFSPGGSPIAVLTGKLAAEAVLKPGGKERLDR